MLAADVGGARGYGSRGAAEDAAYFLPRALVRAASPADLDKLTAPPSSSVAQGRADTQAEVRTSTGHIFDDRPIRRYQVSVTSTSRSSGVDLDLHCHLHLGGDCRSDMELVALDHDVAVGRQLVGVVRKRRAASSRGARPCR